METTLTLLLVVVASGLTSAETLLRVAEIRRKENMQRLGDAAWRVHVGHARGPGRPSARPVSMLPLRPAPRPVPQVETAPVPMFSGVEVYGK